MKKIICMLLAALLLLTGCQAPAGETSTPPETTAAPGATIDPDRIVESPTEPEFVIREPGEGDIAFENPGKVRITYTGMEVDIRYITSVEQLPDEEALAGYDAEFFENRALLIVVETVGSGSVQLEIGSIQVQGDTAIVDIERTMSGDVGTADMATWLLWAEVEKGLDYTWRIKDRTVTPAGEKY